MARTGNAQASMSPRLARLEDEVFVAWTGTLAGQAGWSAKTPGVHVAKLP